MSHPQEVLVTDWVIGKLRIAQRLKRDCCLWPEEVEVLLALLDRAKRECGPILKDDWSDDPISPEQELRARRSWAGFTGPSCRVLARYGVTVDDAARMGDAELMEFSMIGKKTVQRIRAFLAERERKQARLADPREMSDGLGYFRIIAPQERKADE